MIFQQSAAILSHRAFEIPDILAEICEHLAPTDASFEALCTGRVSLSRTARVCRAFLYPATAVLWRVLDDMMPLLTLFSSFQAVPVPEAERRSLYSFHAIIHVLREEIHQKDWARFQGYARHVRALMNAGTINIDPAVFSSMSCFGLSQPLIPALMEFHGEIPLAYGRRHHYDIDDAELLSVMSPSVHRLHIKLRDRTGRTQPPFPSDDVPQILLCKINSLVPHLRTLQIQCQGVGSHLPTSRILSRASVAGLRELSEVDVSRCRSICTPDLLCHLSSLATLVSLAVEVGVQEDSEGLACGGFHALQSLTARGEMSGIARLISSVRSPDLRSIQIYQKQGDVAEGAKEAWCEVIGIISLQFSSSLREFQMKTAYFKFWDSEEHEIEEKFLHIIQPLLILQQMERLSVGWFIERTRLWLEDEDMLEIASAWPGLQELELHLIPRVSPHIECLINIARLCPDLRKLVLPPLIASHKPVLESFPIMSHGLRHVSLGNPDDPDQVAQIVDRLFPNLELVHRRTPLGGWARVTPLLIDLQAARRALI